MRRITLVIALILVFGFSASSPVSAGGRDKHDGHHPMCKDTQELDVYNHCQPKRCPYDVSLTVTDKECVKPPPCQYDNTLLSTDDTCVPHLPVSPVDTPVTPPAPDTQTPQPAQDTDMQAIQPVDSNGEEFIGK